MSDDKGWIKLYRKIFDSEIMDGDNPLETIGFMVWLISSANITVKTAFRKIPVKRGQFVTSMRRMIETLHIHHRKAKRYLDWFVEQEVITVETVGTATLITVLNYDKYQNIKPLPNGNTNGNTNGNKSGNASGKQLKNDKEHIKNDKEESSDSEFGFE